MHIKTFGVVTTSDALSQRKLDIVNRGCDRLQSLGFRVKKGLTIAVNTGVGAGSPQERAKDLAKMCADPEVDAILFAWGGEVTSQILDIFDAHLLNGKPLFGHSDYTVLFNAWYARDGVVSYYWHFASSLDPSWEWFSKYDEEQFLAVLQKNGSLLVPPADTRRVLRHGSASGTLLGGCITDFAKLIGTPFMPNLEGSILLLESYTLRPEELVAHLVHYRQAGLFDKISGLLLGNFMVELSDEAFDKLILDNVGKHQFPILKTREFGHNAHMAPLPIGGKVRIDATDVILE